MRIKDIITDDAETVLTFNVFSLPLKELTIRKMEEEFLF